ncbi:MarR family transcriptional regulator [Streptomyces yunnanensis]|uniref:MarR family transcriptional regulator n=1 Tax=Streptomyces yunnanensis TaxID=156453 RepID=A0ABY8AEW8_9ACTN|nr:MarR family transcriptional regulator [Streptomyces yunnanensis]WEB43550.1 MarR family transcriptional regulator [Streptomyces yunnanensis]
MAQQPLTDTPMHLLRRALQQLTAVWQAEVPDLTAPQYAVLTVLADSPCLTQVELSKATAIDRSTMTTMLDRLTSRGWITREVDPAHRRRHQVRLTPEGHALLRRVAPAADRANHWLTDRLGAQRVDELLPLLRDLAEVDTERSD